MPSNQLSGRINVEVMPEQWWSSLTTVGWRFQKVLDGTGRDPPNPTYTCVVKMTPRGQYITWKNALRGGIGTSKWVVPRRKPYEIKNLACFKEKLIVIFVLIHQETLKFYHFSFRFDLVFIYPRSTNLLFGPLAFKPKTSLGSIQIESLQYHILYNKSWA